MMIVLKSTGRARRLFLVNLIVSLSFLAMCLASVYLESGTLFAESKVFSSFARANIPVSLIGIVATQILILSTVHLVWAAIVTFLYTSATVIATIQERSYYLLGVLVLLLSFIFLLFLNFNYFPNSLLSLPFIHILPSIGRDQLGGMVTGALWGFACLIALQVFFAARRIHFARWFPSAWLKRPIWIYILIAAVALPLIDHTLFLPTDTANAHGEQRPEKPHVFIVGIDSLRPDLIGPSSRVTAAGSLTPNIDRFLENAVVFPEAYTPLARTYPAWISILSGKLPVTSNARFNLQDPDLLAERPLPLMSHLKRHGYRTIYAIDERRFNNIDGSYGPDRIVGPRQGAGDFLLGKFIDTPLSNLLINSFVGKHLFPYHFANRAVSNTYLPSTFHNEIVSELSRLDPGMPAFLSVHFCMPHWPYSWAFHDKIRTYPMEQEFNPNYLSSIAVADEQFGRLMNYLEENGWLKNALVFVISDHGEGFIRSPDVIDGATPEQRAIAANGLGHGTSVFNRDQYRVVFAVKSTGSAPSIAGIRRQSVNLVDIAPTIYDWLDSDTPRGIPSDGISLVHHILSPKTPITERNHIIETGFWIPAISTGMPDEMAAINQALGSYRLTDDARLEIKNDRFHELLAEKQFAITNGKEMFAVIPDREHPEVFVSWQNNIWYDAVNLPEAATPKYQMLKMEFCAKYEGSDYLPQGLCETGMAPK